MEVPFHRWAMGTDPQFPEGMPIYAASLIAAAIGALTILPANAETPPERASLSLKVLDYRDSQPNVERIKVGATALAFVAPVNGSWSLDGSMVSDVISGASPAYHTVERSLAKITERRHAVDLNLTRYLTNTTIKIGVSSSNESDYQSRAISTQISLPSDDRNTTFKIGVGIAKDKIQSNVDTSLRERKTTVDWMLGLTQVVTPNDIAQVVATYVNGQGYFTDPYKVLDNRPRIRQAKTLMARWNHFFVSSESTLRASYRYYTDTNDIRSHTISGEYAITPGDGWSITPLVRIYSQTAARFYADPNPKFPTRVNIPDDYVPGESLLSFDQRLSAFGALTLGVKVVKRIDDDWSVDIKFERYEQRSQWTLSGAGSPGLAPFHARTVQLGLTRQF